MTAAPTTALCSDPETERVDVFVPVNSEELAPVASCLGFLDDEGDALFFTNCNESEHS